MTSKRAAAGSRQGARGANERAVGPLSVALRGPGPRGPEVRSGGGAGRRGAVARTGAGPRVPGARRSPVAPSPGAPEIVSCKKRLLE